MSKGHADQHQHPAVGRIMHAHISGGPVRVEIVDLVETGGWHARQGDGSLIIYVDRKYPSSMWEEIAFHEQLEADLMDHEGLPYNEAHARAEIAERSKYGDDAFNLSEVLSTEIALQNAATMQHLHTKNVPERKKRPSPRTALIGGVAGGRVRLPKPKAPLP